MTPEERKAWVATLKVGDEVAVVIADYGPYITYDKSAVGKITAGGRLRVRCAPHLLFSSGGECGYARLEPWTPEIEALTAKRRLAVEVWTSAGNLDRAKLDSASIETLTALRDLLAPLRRGRP